MAQQPQSVCCHYRLSGSSWRCPKLLMGWSYITTKTLRFETSMQTLTRLWYTWHYRHAVVALTRRIVSCGCATVYTSTVEADTEWLVYMSHGYANPYTENTNRVFWYSHVIENTAHGISLSFIENVARVFYLCHGHALLLMFCMTWVCSYIRKSNPCTARERYIMCLLTYLQICTSLWKQETRPLVS